MYFKEPCVRADTEALFFLHLSPVDVNDLPDGRQQHGFDNLDSDFHEHGRRFNGKCQTTIALPGYGIAGIRTGQYISGKAQVWKVEFPFQ